MKKSKMKLIFEVDIEVDIDNNDPREIAKKIVKQYAPNSDNVYIDLVNDDDESYTTTSPSKTGIKILKIWKE